MLPLNEASWGLIQEGHVFAINEFKGGGLFRGGASFEDIRYIG